jgi:hypothetical protein
MAMARTRKCECEHTWNEHDALTDGFGRTLISCMHIERVKSDDGSRTSYNICACKEWRPTEPEEVSVPSAQ